MPCVTSCPGTGTVRHPSSGETQPGIDVARDVVALPVLEQERRRRHAGVAEHVEPGPLDPALVHVRPQLPRGDLRDRRFLGPRVVVAEDQEDGRVAATQLASQPGEVLANEAADELVMRAFACRGGEERRRQQVAAEKHRRWPVRPNGVEELVVAIDTAVEVGCEQARGHDRL